MFTGTCRTPRPVLNHFEVADEIIDRLRKENHDEFAQSLVDAIRGGSTGTEICLMMLGTLRQIRRSDHSIEKETLLLVDDLIRDLHWKVTK